MSIEMRLRVYRLIGILLLGLAALAGYSAFMEFSEGSVMLGILNTFWVIVYLFGAGFLFNMACGTKITREALSYTGTPPEITNWYNNRFKNLGKWRGRVGVVRIHYEHITRLQDDLWTIMVTCDMYRKQYLKKSVS